MINVMLIDDDAMIRNYLRDVIQWDKLHLRLCCEAGDSETARELYALHRPKIIVTDINIPIISGLELAKEFVAADKDIHIIVITGYGDFDNVRDSISLGAVDLLSKPIHPEEINASLRKAVNRFAQLQRQYHTEQALSGLLAENRSLLQERCIARLFDRPSDTPEAHIRKQFELLSLNFQHRWLTAVIIQLNTLSSDDLGGAAFPTVFKKQCESAFLNRGFQIFSFFIGADRLDCLINWPFDEGDERIEAVLTQLQEETRFYFQTGFSASIGVPTERLTQMFHCAQQARNALLFDAESCQDIINCRNLNSLAQGIQSHAPWPTDQLLDLAQNLRRVEFRKLLNELCRNLSLELMQEQGLDLISRMAGLCTQSGISPWASVNYPETVARIFASSTSSEGCEHLCTACEQLMDALSNRRADSKNHLIRAAKSYIHDHMDDPDLSLDEVSSHVNLSKIYFCKLFHKEEGISFVAYLNNVRMERACTLLRSTGKKILEISNETGYRNPKYFNYVFKRIMGISPLDYRKSSDSASMQSIQQKD